MCTRGVGTRVSDDLGFERALSRRVLRCEPGDRLRRRALRVHADRRGSEQNEANGEETPPARVPDRACGTVH
jgi:hypothetical protein